MALKSTKTIISGGEGMGCPNSGDGTETVVLLVHMYFVVCSYIYKTLWLQTIDDVRELCSICVDIPYAQLL